MEAKAYTVHFTGHLSKVTASFDQAMRHVACIVVPDPKARENLGRLDEFTGLSTKELAGSYYQRIRYACEGHSESIEIVEHDLNRAPALESSGFSIDLINTFDPSYELQAALYRASETETDLGEIADDLHVEITDGIEEMKRFGASAENIVAELREIERIMGGVALIPEAGDPDNILRQLPYIAEDKFRELAAEAFPEEAPSLKRA